MANYILPPSLPMPQSLRLLSLSTNETLPNPSPKRQATVTGPDSVLSRESGLSGLAGSLVLGLLVLCVLPEFQDVRIHHTHHSYHTPCTIRATRLRPSDASRQTWAVMGEIQQAANLTTSFAPLSIRPTRPWAF